MDVHEAVSTAAFGLPLWSAAEFLDTPLADGLVLRAVICRLAPGRRHWIIMSIDAGRGGEVISRGTERTVDDARRLAAAEADKCLRDPFG